MSLDLKLVAYEPNGERIGELPQPLSIESADPLSDTPALELKYSAHSVRSELLERPIEIAREVFDPNTREWFEPVNSRFMLIRTEGDRLDPTGVMSYIAPGYAWQLNKVAVYPLSKAYLDGQVSDASKNEESYRSTLNAAEDALAVSVGKDKNVAVEYSTNAPSSQSAIWVDTTTPHEDLSGVVPKTYNRTTNAWVSHGTNATNDPQARAAWTAYKAYVAHQESQGQLRDTQSRAKLTRRTFVGHAGQVMATLIAEARARGNRLPGMVTNFTSTHDSAGNAWPASNASIEINTGTSLLRVLQNFVESGQLDFRTNGRELQLYTQETVMSRDLSTQVVLRYTSDVDEAPDKATWENVANEVLFLGEDGLSFTRKNAETAAPWGNWELAISQSNVNSEATGILLATNALKESAGERIERTRSLAFGSRHNYPLPYVHYVPGDYVLAQNSQGQMESQRVNQITLTKDGESSLVAGNVVLNDRFLEREIRNQRTTEALVGGGSLGGTGGARNPETYVDLRTPEAPRYVELEADTQAVEGGQYDSLVGASWWWSRKATNGTVLEDGLSHFDVHYRLHQEGTSSLDGNRLAWKNAGEASPDAWSFIIGPLEAFNSITRAPAIYEVRVRASGLNGKVSAWSSVARIQVPLDNEPPKAPSRPSAQADGPLVSVLWDGKNLEGGAPPPDFSHLTLEEAVVEDSVLEWINQGQTQDLIDTTLEALTWTAAPAAGDTVAAGTTMIPSREYGVHYAYRLLAHDYAANISEPSKPSNVVTPVPLVDVKAIQDELDAGNFVLEGVKDEINKHLVVTRDKLSAEGVMAESVAQAFYGDLASFIRVSTTQLMVSDPAVYAPSTTEDPAAWTMSGSASLVQGPTAGSIGTKTDGSHIRFGAEATGAAVAVKRRIYPGDKLAFKFDWTRDGGANGDIRLITRFRDVNGTSLPLPPTYSATDATSGTLDSGTLATAPTAPADATHIEVWVQYLPGTVTAGRVTVSNLRVYKQVGATLIENGAITTDKIVTNAVTAGKLAALAVETGHLAANAVTADKADVGSLVARIATADLFVGKEFKGGTFTGARFQTHASLVQGIKISETGMSAYNVNTQEQMFSLNATTGHAEITGRIRTGANGEPGIIISNANSGWNGVDQGIWYTTNGTAYGFGSTSGTSVAGLWTSQDPDQTTYFPLNIRGNGAAGVTVWDGMTMRAFYGTQNNIKSSGHLRISSSGEIVTYSTGDTEFQVPSVRVIKFLRGGVGYDLPSGQSANMYMDSNGLLHRTSSARKYKTNIVEYQPDEEILNTPLLRWQDKRSVEIHERLKDAPRPFVEEDQRAWDTMDLAWHVGSTSEDALAHKADAIVTYANGEVEGLSYDRFAFMMLPFLRELWADYKARTAQ